MNSIINKIALLRNNKPLKCDLTNNNKYCIVAKEEDGTKTAYCFGMPIYNSITRKLVDFKFLKRNEEWYYDGTNSHISIKGDICLTASSGDRFTIKTFSKWEKNEGGLSTKGIKLFPTLNGILMKITCDISGKATIRIATDKNYSEKRINNKCFSLMKEKFVPYLTVSLCGGSNLYGELISPCIMECVQFKNEYILNFAASDPKTNEIVVEVDLYDGKLFQDTTVESADPTSNNVFGGVAYIGKTSLYGEQWLYSRIDFSKIPHLLGIKANRIILHIPQLNQSVDSLSVYPVSLRFCSFGSNWNNKSPFANKMKKTDVHDGYQSIDITEYYNDMLSGRISQTEGLIIKHNDNNSNYVAISTGDNTFAPQILEIRYK